MAVLLAPPPRISHRQATKFERKKSKHTWSAETAGGHRGWRQKVSSAPPSVQLWERLSHSHPPVEAYPVTAARSPDRVQSRFRGVSGKSASPPPTPEVLAASQYRRSAPGRDILDQRR